MVPSITQKIKSLAWGFKNDLENLEKKFIRIQAVTKDCENFKITESLQDWLEDLRDVAYDVDDVLDDFLYLLMRKKTSLTNKVCDSFSVSSNNPLYMRIKKLFGKKSLDLRVCDGLITRITSLSLIKKCQNYFLINKGFGDEF